MMGGQDVQYVCLPATLEDILKVFFLSLVKLGSIGDSCHFVSEMK